jgi:hypothetical protein
MGDKERMMPSAGSERGCDARVDSIHCGGVLRTSITAERRRVLSNSADIHIGDLASVLLQLEADPAFQQLCASERRVNPYQILGRESRERWHSAFWTWLLAPNELHDLHDFALRRLLTLSADPVSGAIPGVRLHTYGQQMPVTETSEPFDLPVDATSELLTVIDIQRLNLDRTIVAPGTLKERAEVSVSVEGQRAGRRNCNGRFAILIVSDLGAREDARISTVNRVLGVVVEMKVLASYDSDQLRRYSKWVHGGLLVSGIIPSPQHPKFIEAMQHVRPQTANLEWFGVGCFVCPAERSPARAAGHLKLEHDWAVVTLEQLFTHVLEPALRKRVVDSRDQRPEDPGRTVWRVVECGRGC